MIPSSGPASFAPSSIASGSVPVGTTRTRGPEPAPLAITADSVVLDSPSFDNALCVDGSIGRDRLGPCDGGGRRSGAGPKGPPGGRGGSGPRPGRGGGGRPPPHWRGLGRGESDGRR